MVQGCFPDALLQDKEEYEYFYITVSGEFKNRADNFSSLSAIEASFHEGSGQSLHRVCEQFGGKISTPGLLISSLPLPSFLLREGQRAQSQVSQF